ncbi:hypothetical protein PSECIP111951_03145 [Pseudoalteromonas holothuriae]|uniref:Uncharacterized protein n=1 Tax=Pseudoalteromonas holothuriae TaxID=2963714 RepID=A0A9W4R2W9_9GAMM|nr:MULTISPECIES: hypothetical protein [unclassified Pseudoalteromonas]CAH9063958.1 hypothetical protein PSECIP111854_03328 [Pseudoalteromonas sp. CIP111854]CAH9064496.1 hypothetical protein PSECIP111951_03145 [Pseudoalteromonas sp. CIP111951]
MQLLTSFGQGILKHKCRLLALLCGVLSVWLLVAIIQGQFADSNLIQDNKKLYQSNQHYLAQVEQQILKDLADVNVLNAALNVAKSSQFGISFIVDFNVEIGSLLTDLSNLLEKSSHYLFWSMALVGAIQAFTFLAEQLSPWVFQAMLLYVSGWAFLCVCQPKLRHRPSLQWLAKAVVTIFVICHLIIPYSIHVSAQTSHLVAAELGHKADLSYFSDVAQEMHTGLSSTDLKAHAKHGVKVLHKALAIKLSDKVLKGNSVVTHNLAHKFIAFVLLPLLFAWLLYLLIRRCLQSLLRPTRQTPLDTPLVS